MFVFAFCHFIPPFPLLLSVPKHPCTLASFYNQFDLVQVPVRARYYVCVHLYWHRGEQTIEHVACRWKVQARAMLTTLVQFACIGLYRCTLLCESAFEHTHMPQLTIDSIDSQSTHNQATKRSSRLSLSNFSSFLPTSQASSPVCLLQCVSSLAHSMCGVSKFYRMPITLWLPQCNVLRFTRANAASVWARSSSSSSIIFSFLLFIYMQ